MQNPQMIASRIKQLAKDNNISIGIKSLIIIFFLLITNPVASHAMAKAAYKHLDEKSNKVKYDHYGRDIK